MPADGAFFVPHYKSDSNPLLSETGKAIFNLHNKAWADEPKRNVMVISRPTIFGRYISAWESTFKTGNLIDKGYKKVSFF